MLHTSRSCPLSHGTGCLMSHPWLTTAVHETPCLTCAGEQESFTAQEALLKERKLALAEQASRASALQVTILVTEHPFPLLHP